jgi:uncharacterized membrane protein YphA (DoxX/SURF4 family)
MKTIRGILFVIFLFEGVTKLLSLDFQVTFFTNWGYSFSFMYIIGALEVLGAIGLLIKPLRLLANIGLIGIMIGALYTHLSSGDAIQMMVLAVVASALLVIHLSKYLKARKISLAK